VQAHEGDIDLVAAHTLRLTAGVKLVLQAPEVEVISQGAATRWGGGAICEQARGAYVIRSATFSHGGAGDGVPDGVKVPGEDLKFDQHIVLVDACTDLPVAGRRCRIHVEDGQVIEAITDAQGKVPVFRSTMAYARYTVEILD
jgi:type VI secretion system secreted protein VgrG